MNNTIQQYAYDNFSVHVLGNDHSFMHIEINNEEVFFKRLISFILDETRLIQYVYNKKGIMFTPTKKNYVSLVKRLSLFIDDEIRDISIENSNLADILADEFESYMSDDGEFMIRLSKIGRFGEYIFHILLSEYFRFDCIIPKISLTTDKNMSVYGIDELFYDPQNNRILFGESKVSKSLENGVALVNESLRTYEQQITEEFMLCISETLISKGNLPQYLIDNIENAFSFEEFVKTANIKSIGIPIFVCHGKESNPTNILKRLNTAINKKSLFGLHTEYICISLPILSKEIFTQYLTASIKMQLDKIEAQYEHN